MKRITMSLVAMMLLGSASVPALAQEEKEKNKDKESKKEQEHIIITRKNSNEKMVIEINGDKITVNGKDVKEIKDGSVTVSRNKFRNHFGDGTAYTFPRNGNWDDFDVNNGYISLGENRAMLGVVTEDAENGVEVTEVTKESAASKAGLKSGDVITKINDKQITSPDQLSETIRAQKPGDKVTVTYLRDKKEQKVTAELGKFNGFFNGNFDFKAPDIQALEELRSLPRTQRPGQAYTWSGNSQRLGLSVQDTDDGKGVKIIEVDEDSHAAKAGLKEGDLVTQINGQEITSADQVAKIVKENKEKVSIQLQLKRDGKTQNVEVKMPRKIKTVDM